MDAKPLNDQALAVLRVSLDAGVHSESVAWVLRGLVARIDAAEAQARSLDNTQSVIAAYHRRILGDPRQPAEGQRVRVGAGLMADEARNAVDAVAQAWASIDGKLEHYLRERDQSISEQALGHGAGYEAEATELIVRLRARGFDVLKVRA